MGKPFRTTRRIEFADTDMAGIAHFSNFFRFMEAAEQAFLRSLGFAVVIRWEGRHIGFPRVSAACDYVRPACFEDEIDIDVHVEKVGAKSVTYGFDFTKAGQLVARGQITAVCCRVVKDYELESIEIPPEMRQKLEQAKA